MRYNKIRYIDIILLFSILFPIMPSYFEIGNLAVINILCLCVITAKFLFFNNKIVLQNRISARIIILLLLWEVIVCLIHGSLKDYIITFIYIFAVFIVSTSIDTYVKFQRVLDCIIFTAGIVAIFGIIESVMGFNIFSLLNTSGDPLNYNPPRFGITRIISSSGHAIEYCLYCMMCLSLTFYRIVNLNKRTEKTKYMIIYILLSINAILTLSRSSILCLLACQFLLLYQSGFTYFLKTIIKVLLIVICLIIGLSIIIPEIGSLIQSFILMFLALFSDSYSDAIALSFGNDNLSGFGNRFDLYGWVFDDLKGHYFFGMGPDAHFSYSFTESNGLYSWTTVKESIEVNYLSTLWHFGIVSVALEVITLIKIVFEGYKTKRNMNEKRISFSKLCSINTISYMVSWFAVSRGTEFKIFILIIGLYYSYLSISNNLHKSTDQLCSSNCLKRQY